MVAWRPLQLESVPGIGERLVGFANDDAVNAHPAGEDPLLGAVLWRVRMLAQQPVQQGACVCFVHGLNLGHAYPGTDADRRRARTWARHATTARSTNGAGTVMLSGMSSTVTELMPDAQGHFGPYGGRYVPETLMHPLQELETEYLRAQRGPRVPARVRLLPEGVLRPAHAALLRGAAHPGTGRRARSISSAKTCSTRARTKSITASARSCSPGAWARRASSPKPARASTAWPRPPSPPCSGSSASSIWGRLIASGRRSTSCA